MIGLVTRAEEPEMADHVGDQIRGFFAASP
jgi:hypothetical protein